MYHGYCVFAPNHSQVQRCAVRVSGGANAVNCAGGRLLCRKNRVSRQAFFTTSVIIATLRGRSCYRTANYRAVCPSTSSKKRHTGRLLRASRLQRRVRSMSLIGLNQKTWHAAGFSARGLSSRQQRCPDLSPARCQPTQLHATARPSNRSESSAQPAAARYIEPRQHLSTTVIPVAVPSSATTRRRLLPPLRCR